MDIITALKKAKEGHKIRSASWERQDAYFTIDKDNMFIWDDNIARAKFYVGVQDILADDYMIVP